MPSDRSDEDLQATILVWLDRKGACSSSGAMLLSQLLVGADVTPVRSLHSVMASRRTGNIAFSITRRSKAQILRPSSCSAGDFSRDEKRVFCHSFEAVGADRDSFDVYPPAGRGQRFSLANADMCIFARNAWRARIRRRFGLRATWRGRTVNELGSVLTDFGRA